MQSFLDLFDHQKRADQSCSKKNIENDWSKEKLKGKVLEYREFSYEALERFGKTEKGKRQRDFYWNKDHHNKYDINGNKVEETNFTIEGKLSDRTFFQYNSNGKLIEKSFYISDNKLSARWTYKYDQKAYNHETLSKLYDLQASKNIT